jgi:hypothetical protein
MSPGDIVFAAVLLGLIALAAMRRGAWRRPRALAWIAGFAVVGLAIGVAAGLVLGAIASASSAALYVILGAFVLFEIYCWRRRRT